MLDRFHPLDYHAFEPVGSRGRSDRQQCLVWRWAIELDELRRAVAAADPSAILVPSRILRRVVKRDRHLTWLGGARPTSYVIAGQALAAIVRGPEVGRPAGAEWPAISLLIAQPEPEEIAVKAPGVILTAIWRRLFHAHVVRKLGFPAPSAAIGAAGLARRIAAIGETEFDEARHVLRNDGLLLRPESDHATYQTFAAVFLELTCFEPPALPVYFPAIESPEQIRGMLDRDLDSPSLLAATRPAGAPERPVAAQVLPAEAEPISETVPLEEPALLPGEQPGRARRYASEARKASERGNSVRAAILWIRLANLKEPGEDKVPRAAARAALKELAVRLRKALFVQKGESPLWASALAPLLDRAAGEYWSSERRLLHDLQNVCLDHEREVFRLEPMGWILSLGRRPLRHPLPHLREVTMSRHLRSAAGRLRRVRLSAEARGRLEGLLRVAVDRAEEALRERFRPWVDSTLEAIWVRPDNLPERVAYRKLVEEVLDPIESRGFTRLGDLRDAASRGNLKLQDLTGATELIRGDRLLQVDRALAEVLDGVHRRGEVYLRGLQRFSALAFGTPVGRLLTLFFALPFGGAFVLLKGVEEINHVMLAPLTGWHIHVTSFANLLVLGLVALGIINYVRFRRRFLAVLGAMGRALRLVAFDLPSMFFCHPVVRRLLGSKPVRFVWRFALKPGLAGGLLAALATGIGLKQQVGAALGLCGFVVASFLFNTRTGQVLEEVAVERIARALRGLIFEVIPGLFHLIVLAFARALEWVEKLIYAGDEWLRFREGQSRGLLAIKAVLGLVWSVVTYVVRIYLNLLVEPQLNPIKHFPVVTVAAKIMLPFALTLTRILALGLTPLLGSWIGHAVAGVTVFFLPGVFGFLVWELKSNWRLYEANRPEALGPLAVGSHGETVVRLLRPGFHSGTLPKLFARQRRALRDGRERKAARNREALLHVDESVRRLIDRDLVAWLHESRASGGHSISPGAIHFATNRIGIELVGAGRKRAGLWIDLEERSGLLTARVRQPGWLDSLKAAERRTLGIALAGFFKMCGVERVKVCTGQTRSTSVRSDSASEPVMIPEPVDFSRTTISWRQWVDAWKQESAGVEAKNVPAWNIHLGSDK